MVNLGENLKNFSTSILQKKRLFQTQQVSLFKFILFAFNFAFLFISKLKVLNSVISDFYSVKG